MGNLTPKQEGFCQSYVRLGDQAAAYREAYNAENMADTTVWREASRLANDHKVATRIEEIQRGLAKETGVTVERLTDMLNTAYDLAIEKGMPSAGVQAVMGLAKLHGLLVRRVETADVTPTRSVAEIDARIRELLADHATEPDKTSKETAQ